jgi:hypothetical protein
VTYFSQYPDTGLPISPSINNRTLRKLGSCYSVIKLSHNNEDLQCYCSVRFDNECTFLEVHLDGMLL